jgi:hypothetical protein
MSYVIINDPSVTQIAHTHTLLIPMDLPPR